MLLAECDPLRAAIDEEFRHGNEQLGRLGGNDAAFGELAGALLSFSGLFGGEFATLVNAAAQLDELDGSREPSSSSSWAAALTSVANSPPKRPLKLKSAPASSPNAASLPPRRPSCSFPWRNSSSIAARKGSHSAKSIKTFPKTYTYLAFAQDFEK